MVTNTPKDAAEPSSSPGLLPLSILRGIWKRKIPIVLTWILLVVVTFAVVRLLPTVYMAESVVLIDSQKIPEKFVSATVASDLEDRVAAIKETLLSGGELKKVIDEFGLYQEQRKTHFEEEILDMMRKDISITVDVVGNSSKQRPGAFHIGYQGSDPSLVMRVANRLTDLYVEQNLKTREGQAEGTSAFLDTQLSEAKKRLDELEAAVSAYKVKHNGELPEQEQSLTNGLVGLHTQLQANMDALNRAHQTKVVQEGNLSAMQASAALETMHALETVPRASSLVGVPAGSYKKTSEVLEAQLAELLTRVTEKHSDVIKLRAAIEAAKQQEELEQSRESALKAEIELTEKQAKDGMADQQRILREISLYQRRIEQLPVRQQEMEQLTRDYEMSKTNYKSLLDKKMAAEMALDMERRQQSERFTIMDRAQLPEKPIKPKRQLLYAGGSVIGLIVAVLLGLGMELRHNVILGEWELKDNVPVLARLPRFTLPVRGQNARPARRGLFGRFRNRSLSSASAACLVLAGIATVCSWSHGVRL